MNMKYILIFMFAMSFYEFSYLLVWNSINFVFLSALQNYSLFYHILLFSFFHQFF